MKGVKESEEKLKKRVKNSLKRLLGRGLKRKLGRRLRVDAEKYIGDTFYDTNDNRGYLKGKKKAIIPSSLKQAPPVVKFKGGKARYQAGKSSIGRVRQSEGWLYYFSTKDCGICKFRRVCVRK